jgi:hypothetical protein
MNVGAKVVFSLLLSLMLLGSFSCTLTSSRWSFFVLPENYRMMNRAEIFCRVRQMLHHLPACTYVLFMCMWITYSSSTDLQWVSFGVFVSFKACRRITCTFPTAGFDLEYCRFGWVYPLCAVRDLNVTALWLGSSGVLIGFPDVS